MEYRHLVSNPKYHNTWKNAYDKELGWLTQGLPGIVQGTNTIVFIHRADVPPDQWKDTTYGCIVANFRPKKMTLIVSVSQLAAIELTSLGIAAHPQQTRSL
jgi:hypothetical protein